MNVFNIALFAFEYIVYGPSEVGRKRLGDFKRFYAIIIEFGFANLDVLDFMMDNKVFHF